MRCDRQKRKRRGEMVDNEKEGFSRRDFLKLAGITAFGLGVDCGFAKVLLGDDVVAIPASQGYLLVDFKKCAGCMSCMLLQGMLLRISNIRIPCR